MHHAQGAGIALGRLTLLRWWHGSAAGSRRHRRVRMRSLHTRGRRQACGHRSRQQAGLSIWKRPGAGVPVSGKQPLQRAAQEGRAGLAGPAWRLASSRMNDSMERMSSMRSMPASRSASCCMRSGSSATQGWCSSWRGVGGWGVGMLWEFEKGSRGQRARMPLGMLVGWLGPRGGQAGGGSQRHPAQQGGRAPHRQLAPPARWWVACRGPCSAGHPARSAGRRCTGQRQSGQGQSWEASGQRA